MKLFPLIYLKFNDIWKRGCALQTDKIRQVTITSTYRYTTSCIQGIRLKMATSWIRWIEGFKRLHCYLFLPKNNKKKQDRNVVINYLTRDFHVTPQCKKPAIKECGGGGGGGNGTSKRCEQVPCELGKLCINAMSSSVMNVFHLNCMHINAWLVTTFPSKEKNLSRTMH